MKNRISKVVMIAASLMLYAGLASAVEVKATAPDVTGAAKSATSTTKASAAAAKSGVVDINTASEAELKSIPGLGGAYASKIIAGRPYANKGQLKSRNILPEPAYEKIKDQIVAKRTKK